MRLGDLDALKEALFIKFGNQLPNGLFEEIDNAPTVEPEKAKESEIIKAYTKGFDTGVETVKGERPQGEWICVTKSTFPQYQPDEYKCPFCNTIVNYKTNYCHNCGAKMKGGM